MKKLGFILVLGFFSLVFCSCEKSDNDNLTDDLKDIKGIINYLGDIAADGCGWVVTVDSIDFKPVELHEDFQIDGLPVIIDYKNSGETIQCGFSSKALDKITISNMVLDSSLLKHGIVRYSGDLASDGCGWIINIDSLNYIPLELEESFRKGELPVFLFYEITSEKYRCEFSSIDYDVIRIIFMSNMNE